MSVRENLIKAKALIDAPEKWHKGSLRNGSCLCAMGAVWDSLKSDGHTGWCRGTLEYRAVVSALPEPFNDVPPFNDDPNTTHADIIALFDRAIEGAE